MSRRFVIRAILIVAIVGVSAFFASILLKSPSHDRQWKTEYRVLPRVEFDGDVVTVRNIRNFSYNADGSIRAADYYDRSFDLARLSSVSYGISHFYDYGLAHTFLSFGFDDGHHLVISIEARQEIGEAYDPFDGLLRNYELIYVVGDERDIIGLRTHIRKERVLLYRINVERERIVDLFGSMARRINQIHARPEFYNTLTDNCTTGIVRYARRLSFYDKYLNYKIILPGYSDELVYKIGLIPNHVPLSEIRARAVIDPKATTLDDPEFSKKIRRL
jgi:hypothetical protein